MAVFSEHRLFPGVIDIPLDIDAVFGRGGPLVLEVGFGSGDFLAELAVEHPDWNLLGVEIAATSVSRGIGMLRREGFGNVRLMCADARFVVRELVARHRLHRVYVNFPDPWPKDRHSGNRLLQEPFFRLLSTRLEVGGELWLTTDHEEYFEFAMAEARASGLFDVRPGPPPPATLRTKYAQRWQKMGIGIHHAVFACTGVDSSPHDPRLEVVDVAHARLIGSLDDIADFETESHEIPLGHVILLDCARSLDGERLLFRVIVEEADLRQELIVEVRPSASGIYVHLEHFGSPAQTRAVRKAVDLVADWLAARGLEKIESAVG